MSLFLQRVAFILMILLCIALLIACISLIISLLVIDVTNYKIESPKIPKSFNGFKIAHLSDLHNFSYGKDNKKILDKLDKIKPDIVVLTGDMVNSDSKNFNTFYKLAKNLSSKYEAYYIMGNHEMRLPVNKQIEIKAKLKSLKINLLDNTQTIIKKDNEHINIYGLEQPIFTYKNNLKKNESESFTIEKMQELLPLPDTNKFNILLSHSPFDFGIFSKWGADLVLSGHVHGGLIRLPFIGGVLSPERTLFPKYSGGEYTLNNSKMILSRGLGNGTINLRILNNPEICVIELKKAKNY